MKWWHIRQRNADLERELRSDLELEEEEQRERCLSPEEARYSARRAFGNTVLFREKTHEAWGSAPFERVLQDIRFSLRTMLRAPRVSLTVLLTLALGIGANTAIFSIVNAALLRALPFHESGQLVQLSADLPGVGSHNVGFSYPELEDIRDRAGIFQAVSAAWPAPGNLTGGDHPERIDILAVSPNYFNILGTRPQLGRLFDPQDIADGFAEAAVISNSLWHKEFGGDQSILGRRVRLDNDLYTVVGVLPPSFRPPTPASARPVGIYGVTSYAFTRRTKELGIRSALGAPPSVLVRMVLTNGMSPVVVGLMIGGIGAISIGRLLTGLLYSVKPTDLVVLTAAGITTVFIGIATNYLPARRAARINPIVALRAE